MLPAAREEAWVLPAGRVRVREGLAAAGRLAEAGLAASALALVQGKLGLAAAGLALEVREGGGLVCEVREGGVREGGLREGGVREGGGLREGGGDVREVAHFRIRWLVCEVGVGVAVGVGGVSCRIRQRERQRG